MCSVLGCDSPRRGAQRFRLPEDPEKRLEWVQFVLEVNGQRLKESSWTDITICREHFTEDCFEKQTRATGKVQLKPGAVPSHMENCTEKWTDRDVQALLNLYGSGEGQQDCDSTKRNKRMYASISEQLAALGVHRTAKQCREKIKKLKQDYKKVKDYNNRCGSEKKTSKWYEKMDAIFGHIYEGNMSTTSTTAEVTAPEGSVAEDQFFNEAPSAYSTPTDRSASSSPCPLSTCTSPPRPSTSCAHRPSTPSPKLVTAPEGLVLKQEFFNDAPSACMVTLTDHSSSSSPCPLSTCTSPPRPSTSSSQPSTSCAQGRPSSPSPRPARKRKREGCRLKDLVKELIQRDEEDRRTSQESLQQLLALLNEQNAKDAEERERQRAEAAEERRRQDAFHKFLGMLLLIFVAASQQPTHPVLD